MRKRAISTQRQLGTAVHDARVRAGVTQAALAARAGVSRKWLIGVEQGARTGAELGKVLDVLRALDLSFELTERPDQAKSLSGDRTQDAEASSPGRSGGRTTSQREEALKALRRSASPSADALDALRRSGASSSRTPGTLDTTDQERS
ncbi:helix-turn-helix domain-containing protein [Zhihengliuella salsuginis]|uniref:HTH cro/C1-type domain-containing protein n=1 Tax=Zhihengliuella salsuginis TaxID=578222 RepID=A0ABQ3GB14_9MICC|nr:helix-turn-helix domain-containing protein [Zhihengliuella salsuginis]GHC99116.1 hypothetical protein GCM10008096_00930 [Zhihengliuella salsuginis]